MSYCDINWNYYQHFNFNRSSDGRSHLIYVFDYNTCLAVHPATNVSAHPRLVYQPCDDSPPQRFLLQPDWEPPLFGV
jgi:hypothetical protein